MTATLASTAVRPQSATYRVWWTAQRSLSTLAAFRLAAGAALAFHFVRHALVTAPLLAGSALRAAPGFAKLSHASWLASGLSLTALHVVFAAGALLALAVALGVASRIGAALLYALSVVTFWAIVPIAGLDDWMANVTCLFLLLFPAGQRASLLRRTPLHDLSPDTYVPGLAASVFLFQVAALYMSGSLEETNHLATGGRWALLVRLLPIAFIAPTNTLQTLGIAAQLGAHAYALTTTHALLTHVLLAATSILFWGERPRDATQRPAPALDAGSVLALVYAGVLGMALSGSLIGVSPAATRCGRMLSDFGLMPIVGHDRPLHKP